MLTLLQFVARRRLEANGAQLAGLFVGNSIRPTAQPTTARRLEAFQEVYLTGLQERPRQHGHLTPLLAVPLRVLALEISFWASTRLDAEFPKLPWEWANHAFGRTSQRGM
jgi:hypothetical protein